MSDMDPGDFTPPSSLSVKSSQGSRKELPSSHNPTPEPLAYDEGSNLSHSDTLPMKARDVKPIAVKIKVDFIDENGESIGSRFSRVGDDQHYQISFTE
jgi:hypothetical protein